MVRVLITGSRNWTDQEAIAMAIHALEIRALRYEDITIVHGGAQGADTMADAEAGRRGMRVEVHWPDYKAFPGHIAPLKRNDAMLDSGIDLVLAFRLGMPTRGGTQYTIDGATRRRIPVVIYSWPGDLDYRD